MPPIVGPSLRRCWHHDMSSTDPKMKTVLRGGSISGERRQTKLEAVTRKLLARGSIVILSAKTPHGADEVIE